MREKWFVGSGMAAYGTASCSSAAVSVVGIDAGDKQGPAFEEQQMPGCVETDSAGPIKNAGPPSATTGLGNP
ncbi:MAG TPA: hypothetical protein VN176_13290 [Verrucomicrobiae bacterium]|jgi:hypothetical protein|nr:hypothetical protein [Verrucomicrobiae bacterium]